MLENIFSHIGLISGLVSLWAYALYVRSILRGDTKPSRSTWWILSLVGVLILWSSYALGARENLWIQLSYVIGPLVIGFLSLRHGDGGGLSRLDTICLVGAGISALLWVIFNSPLIGLLGSIIVDFIGLLPTIKKAYHRPEEESPNAWLIENIASGLNMLAITTWFTMAHKDWIYALYLFGINTLITLLLWRRRILK